MQSKILLAATAATGALAVRDLSGTFPQVYARALEVRDQSACISVVAAHSTLTDDFPALPTELATLTGVDVPSITDPCSFPSITGSAGQIVTSYSSALQSWQDAHITDIRAVWQACSDVPEVSAVLDQYADAICSTALAPITSADASGSGAAATATGSAATATGSAATATGSAATASGSGASETTASFNAAPRETGLVVAAAGAAAALVGAVML